MRQPERELTPEEAEALADLVRAGSRGDVNAAKIFSELGVNVFVEEVGRTPDGMHIGKVTVIPIED